MNDSVRTAYAILSTAGLVLGTYHGYKRNNSIGWALWWGFAGAVVPFVTVPIAVAQGFAQPQTGTAGYFAR